MNDIYKSSQDRPNLKKEPPFRVPDNYFGDFSARLQTRLEAEKTVPDKEKKGIIRYLKPALGLAASFALVFMLVYWPLRSFLPDYVADTNTVIEQESDIETYIPSFERIDENSFFNMLAETVSGEEAAEEGFNDEELLNYLSANVSDYELYINSEN